MDGVTSDPSKDYQSFTESLELLDREGANIERLLTAAVGLSAEGGEFMEIVYLFSYIDAEVTVEEDMIFDSTTAGVSTSYVVSVIPTVTVGSGVAVTVGTGKTMIIDVLQIGDIET